MKHQYSNLFLRNVTAIDFALLDPVSNMPRGGSLQLSAIVSGKVDKHEAVVVDFSKIKKSIKDIVDDNEHGFDHKLWIPDNYNTHYPQIDVYEEAGEIEIATPQFSTICPTNAVKFVNLDDVSSSITAQLQTELNILYPHVNIQIKTEVNEDMWIPDSMKLSAMKFQYVHGLKNSSSWGCQNINHGHLSWLAICDKNNVSLFIPTQLYARLRHDLNNAIFVWRDNIVYDEGNQINIGYQCERGYFECAYSRDANIRIVDTETTVENLAQWFVNHYRDELTSGELKERGAHTVYLSEGLTKGSFQEI